MNKINETNQENNIIGLFIPKINESQTNEIQFSNNSQNIDSFSRFKHLNKVPNLHKLTYVKNVEILEKYPKFPDSNIIYSRSMINNSQDHQYFKKIPKDYEVKVHQLINGIRCTEESEINNSECSMLNEVTFI